MKSCENCGGEVYFDDHIRCWVCDDCGHTEFDEQEMGAMETGICERCGYEIHDGEWIIDGICQFCADEEEIETHE